MTEINVTITSVNTTPIQTTISLVKEVLGLPIGGVEGQVLSKINDEDYNAEWITNSIIPLSGSEIKTLYEEQLNTNAFTDAEKIKLADIVPQVNNISNIDATDLTDGGDSILHFHSSDRDRINHTGTQTADTITDGSTNKVFTSIEKTKLLDIETEATADQTGAEIKTLYEAESNTNAYTDAEKSKLEGIQVGAEVNTINSDVTGIVGADQITNMVSLTQAEYDAIVTPNASTFYVIVG